MQKAKEQNPISISEITQRKKIDFGDTILSEQEIIDFALVFDPLDFHTNKEKAKNSFFKGLIASGPHIFNHVHKTKWIPLFKDTVICGLEINNWKFLKPVYPNQKIRSTVTIIKTKPNHEKNSVAVTWYYEFKNEAGEIIQSLEMIVLHKIS